MFSSYCWIIFLPPRLLENSLALLILRPVPIVFPESQSCARRHIVYSTWASPGTKFNQVWHLRAQSRLQLEKIWNYRRAQVFEARKRGYIFSFLSSWEGIDGVPDGSGRSERSLSGQTYRAPGGSLAYAYAGLTSL